MMMVYWCFVLLATFITVIDSQPSTQGFISIDCGAPSGTVYQDNSTGIQYVSDDLYIDTGINHNISKSYQSPSKQSSTLRSFPNGTRNCYMLRNVTKGSVYLLRATFLYGNYDGNQTAQISTPLQFDLNLDTTFWRRVNITSASQEYANEVVIGARNDFMWLCLVNINAGTPFISALELRPLPANLYPYVSSYQSYSILFRLNYGPAEDTKIRYPDDPYDRIWSWYQYDNATLTSISTRENIKHSGSANYDAPNAVLQTALAPISSPNLTTASYDTPLDNFYKNYHVILYLAELQKLTVNQSRQFYIYVKDRTLLSTFGGVTPEYLTAKYYDDSYLTTYVCTLAQTKASTLPPILNAMEAYWEMSMEFYYTSADDVHGMMDLKAEYGIVRNWNGDPCYPLNVSWNGVTCYKSASRINSLNLSYSGLHGMISESFAKLQYIAYLDLSHNNLSGNIPDAFTTLVDLQVLNLSGNIIGYVPDTLLKRNTSGSLLLLVDSCINCGDSKSKKSSSVLIIAIIIAAVAIVVSISAVLLMLIWYRRIKKMRTEPREVHNFRMQVHSEIKRFTYSELKDITNKFSRIIGKGGFGVVYHGYLENEIEVAVKVCSPESGQGSRQFLAEVRSLSVVHHKNLVTLVGYCREGDDLAVVYEYMSRGSLFDYLRGKDSSSTPLNWRMRLNITLEAAQGLDYLHAGCGIVHRDVKTSNILLGQNFEAKVSDLGLARMFSAETNSSLITLCGTPGYIDPEYQGTFVLTEKSDVYSFGVILFEIVTGEPPILSNSENIHIVKHVKEKLNKGGIEDVIDSRLNGEYNLNSVWKVVELAMVCTSEKSIDRPTMADVVMHLKESVQMEEQRDKEMSQSSDKSETNKSIMSVSLIGSIQSFAPATR